MIKLLITARMKTFEHETIFLIRMQTFVMQILDSKRPIPKISLYTEIRS